MSGEPAEVRLSAESIEAITAALAEVVGAVRSPEQPEVPPRLLSAAEVARWWGVERSWVYNHAEDLGARRLGEGRRPRLRFDPDEVAERLGAPLPSRRDSRGVLPIGRDSHSDSLSVRSRATVGESGNQAGGRHCNTPSRPRFFRRQREEASDDGS